MKASARASASAGVLASATGKLDDRLTEHAAQAGRLRLARDLLLEVVHVREGRRARLDHLERGQPRARAHELGRDGLGLGRKDVLVQPVHQGQVVRQPAVEHHRRVGVGVDQARQHHLAGGVDRLGAAELLGDGLGRVHRHDVGAVDRHGAVRDHAARGVHRDDGAAGDERATPAGARPDRRARRRTRTPEPQRRGACACVGILAPATHSGSMTAVPLHLVTHPVALDALAELRHKDTRPAAFRAAAHRISTVVATEALRDLPSEAGEVMTPLGPAPARRLTDDLVVAPVLRAGLGHAGRGARAGAGRARRATSACGATRKRPRPRATTRGCPSRWPAARWSCSIRCWRPAAARRRRST